MAIDLCSPIRATNCGRARMISESLIQFVLDCDDKAHTKPGVSLRHLRNNALSGGSYINSLDQIPIITTIVNHLMKTTNYHRPDLKLCVDNSILETF